MQTHPVETLSLSGSVVTVEAFDGVHRGHRTLIRKVVERAAELGAPSVAYSFDPLPRACFRDAQALTLLAKKVRRLDAMR